MFKMFNNQKGSLWMMFGTIVLVLFVIILLLFNYGKVFNFTDVFQLDTSFETSIQKCVQENKGAADVDKDSIPDLCDICVLYPSSTSSSVNSNSRNQDTNDVDRDKIYDGCDEPVDPLKVSQQSFVKEIDNNCNRVVKANQGYSRQSVPQYIPQTKISVCHIVVS